MNIKHINAENFIETAATSDVCVIDLRTPIEVATESLAKFIHLPLQDFSTKNLIHVLKIKQPKTKHVYLLCQSGKRADLAVAKLSENIDLQFTIIDGGLNALKTAGVVTINHKPPVISLERQVRIAAGGLTFLGTLLGFFFHMYFLAIPAFVGLGLVFAGITNTCGMGLLLARMPWNKVSSASS